MRANELLEPTTSAGYYGSPPSALEQTRPVYRGTWVFSDPNKSTPLSTPAARQLVQRGPQQQKPVTPSPKPPPISCIVVQVDFTHDEDAEPEMIGQRYYMLEPDMMSAQSHMDVNLLELGV